MKRTLLALLVSCALMSHALADTLYSATQSDQSALDIGGTQSVVLSDVKVQKTDGSTSSVDDAGFRGVNAAVRVYDQGQLTLSDAVIESSAPHATGLFVYGNGTATVSDTTVTVSGSGAGGIEVAGGGTLYGSNLTVQSASKAAIRSDKGGGTLVLDGGTYTSTGTNGCPAIYSTADITVSNAVCTSENSRAVIIEGNNSVSLGNVVLEGNDQSTKNGSIHANILLYQSMSGDAREGTSEFSMTGGTMTSHSGAMFYCTNTSSVIQLCDVSLNLSDDNTLLIVSAGRWGREGSNGGHCSLEAKEQTLTGSICVDSISSLSLTLSQSTFTGSINSLQEGGSVRVIMEENSSWTLTGDSYITDITGDLSGIDLNGFTLYVNDVPMIP